VTGRAHQGKLGRRRNGRYTWRGSYWPEPFFKERAIFFMKVVKPITRLQRVRLGYDTLRFVGFDYSDGTKEEWYTVAHVRMDSIGVQRAARVRIPTDWNPSNDGPAETGRSIRRTVHRTCSCVGQNRRHEVRVSASRMAGTVRHDLVHSGKIRSARYTSGYKETDKTPPAAVTSVQATGAAYSNIVTWLMCLADGRNVTVYASENRSPNHHRCRERPALRPAHRHALQHISSVPEHRPSAPLYYGVTAQTGGECQ